MGKQSAEENSGHGVLVGKHTEPHEEVVGVWMSGGWMLIQRAFESVERIKMGVGLRAGLCT